MTSEHGQPRLRVGLASMSAQTVGGTAGESHTALRQLVDACVLAERVGLDDVWLSEHHGSSDGYLSAVVPVMGALSAATSRVSIGTGVALGPLHDPLRLAEDMSVLDHLSDGRVLLGLGLGYREVEYRALNRPMRGRAATLESTVGLLRMAWSGADLAGHAGIVEGDGFVATPLPFTAGGPPVLLGAFRRPGVERAARLADGWIAPDLADPDQLLRRLEWLGEPERRPFHVVLTMPMFTASSDAADIVRPGARLVHAQYRRWMAASGGHPTVGYDGGESPPMIAGTPAECVTRLEPWVDVLAALPEWFVPHLSLRLVFPGVDEHATRGCIELTGTVVAPVLRQRFDTRRHR